MRFVLVTHRRHLRLDSSQCMPTTRGSRRVARDEEGAPVRLKISQRTDEFFRLFAESARNLRTATELLKDLIENYTDVESRAHRIQDREHEGDEITHEIIRRLNTSFVTPMDREDIYALASALDDVMDAVDATADLFVLHRIEEPLPEMKALADVLLRGAEQTEQALDVFPRMDRGRLEPYWVEVNRLENEGDRIYRRAVADLFSGDYKAMDVLKWKDVIENLEAAVDGLENVANIIESSVLKHA
jgi:predicted phosphate transport protein (TIGR00153 family)